MKIGTPLVTGYVKEIAPFIYAVVVKDRYDRGMLFCRYQEFYESPYPEIRGEMFTLEEYMKLYRKKTKNSDFTYTSDWCGYNIPSGILKTASNLFLEHESTTGYDEIMYRIINWCDSHAAERNGGSLHHPWYLIGVDDIKSCIMDHEIAHGLYYTNEEYREDMTNIILRIKPSHYNKLKKALVKVGYADDKNIIDDEIQAFMSTGVLRDWDHDICKLYKRYFNKLFQTYKNKNYE